MATITGDVKRRVVMSAALATTCAVMTGCGSAGDGPLDAGSRETGARDSLVGEDAGQNSGGADCGRTPPSGKQLVATKAPVSVLGLTTDGYAIYLDTNAQTLNAEPLAGNGVTVTFPSETAR